MHEETCVTALPAPPALPAMRPGLLRLLDLPHLAFAVLFFWLFFRTELTDPDYFWHLKAGEYIVNHLALPAGDPFSWTFQGKPWALHEWLFEVGLYAMFALLGGTGVKLLTACLGMLATYIVYRAAHRLLGASTLALALAIAFLLVQAGGFAPRPQLVTYVLFAALVHLLVAFKYFGEDRRLWVIPALMQFVDDFWSAAALPAAAALSFELALEEIFINVVTHGSPPGTQPRVEVSLRLEAGSVTMTLEDDGPEFDPLSLPAPDIEADLDARPIGNLGVYLLRRLMDTVSYERRDARNRLTLTKQIAA